MVATAPSCRGASGMARPFCQLWGHPKCISHPRGPAQGYLRKKCSSSQPRHNTRPFLVVARTGRASQTGSAMWAARSCTGMGTQDGFCFLSDTLPLSHQQAWAAFGDPTRGHKTSSLEPEPRQELLSEAPTAPAGTQLLHRAGSRVGAPSPPPCPGWVQAEGSGLPPQRRQRNSLICFAAGSLIPWI